MTDEALLREALKALEMLGEAVVLEVAADPGALLSKEIDDGMNQATEAIAKLEERLLTT